MAAQLAVVQREKLDRHDVNTGLLPGLALCRLRGRLSGVRPAPWQRPGPIVALAHEQYPIIDEDRGSHVDLRGRVAALRSEERLDHLGVA